MLLIDLEKVNMCLLLLKTLYRDPSFLKCKLQCSFMLICVCFGGVYLVDKC